MKASTYYIITYHFRICDTTEWRVLGYPIHLKHEAKQTISDLKQLNQLIQAKVKPLWLSIFGEETQRIFADTEQGWYQHLDFDDGQNEIVMELTGEALMPRHLTRLLVQLGIPSMYLVPAENGKIFNVRKIRV